MPLRFALGVALTAAIGWVLFYLMLRPSLGDLQAMALFLLLTGLVSAAAGYGVYRLGWLRRSPRLLWTLLAGYGLASVLTFLNVYVTARLMFASSHDLQLATVLLIFAGGIAMVLGAFLSTAITEKIEDIAAAAAAIAQGNFRARAPVEGNDELAQLARTFNAMAERLAAADRAQRQTEQMRRDLLAWIGHDLRTPLASLRAVVEALADGVVQEPAQVARYFDTARRDAAALDTLIDELFELAQIDAGGLHLDRQPNSLADLISDTLESFSALAAAQGVQLTGEVQPGVDPVLMDAGKIGRVLANLTTNAIRHTPPGGQVQVLARPVDAARSGLNAASVQVDVLDAGPGIPEGAEARIFEQFYRVEESRSRATGGAGLGLAIARGIVEAHGGRIFAQNRPEGGARFSFLLPRGG